MERTRLVDIAHKALKTPDKLYALKLLESVNLTLAEREIIERSELDRTDIVAGMGDCDLSTARRGRVVMTCQGHDYIWAPTDIEKFRQRPRLGRHWGKERK